MRFKENVKSPIVGHILRNRLGEDISGANSSSEGMVLPSAASGQIYTVDFHLKLPLLQPGNYYFTVAVANGTHENYVICDWIENAILLTVKPRSLVYGYMKFDCQVELKYAGSE